MSIYTYECLTCGVEFDSIEKIGTNFTYCKLCGKISKRIGIELCSPAKLIAGCGGFEKPSHGTRRRE